MERRGIHYPFCWIPFIGILLLSTLKATAEEAKPGSYEAMDYGPVIGHMVRTDWPENNLVRKGLAIRLDHDAALIFDTDLLRFAAATVDGWVDISRTDRTSYKGSDTAAVEGRQVWGASELAGWAKDGRFDGPRDGRYGNLPRDWAHYRGYYRHGNQVVLEYSVGETKVLELPEAVHEGETLAFMRTLRIEGVDEEMRAYLGEKREAWSLARSDAHGLVLDTGEGAVAVRLVGAPGEARLTTNGDRIELHLPPSDDTRGFRIVIFEMSSAGSEAYRNVPGSIAERELPDFSKMTRGGPARWNEEVAVKGTVAEGDTGYVVDRIPLPEDNPWGSWMRPAGLDFFECGTRAVLSTWNGDVWIVSGIDDSLENVTWRRFASGLFYAMGVAVVDGGIYVTERGQLTRLHDLNGNGEADFYENFNNDGPLHPRAHTLTLEVDSAGYFYFFKNGNRVPGDVPQHGALIRVSPDGNEREVFANGIRGANSLGIGPDDTVLSADQQGNLVPTERIDRLQRGKFYGYRPHGGEDLPFGEFEPPVCWVPHGVNNSSGAMHFAGDDRWGPQYGNWILGSYGRQALFAVLTQEIGDVMQGGVVRFPLAFTSGLIRARVNPGDGQLYVAGLRGWGTSARHDGNLDRVRYAGGADYLPTGFGVTPEGVSITFSEPLDRAVVDELDRYEVERWEYIYSNAYGSPEMSVRNPGQEGRDPVEVTGASLSGDAKTLFIEIPDIMPVMQQMVAYDLRFADGHDEENAVYHTIHVLREGDEPARRVRTEAVMEEEVDRWLEEDVEGELPVWFEAGRTAFETNCYTCHQSGGVAPAMRDSDWADGSPEALVRIVLHGKEGNRGIMTPFEWMDDDEIAAILSYIRVRWHDENLVDASDVRRIREESGDREDLWTEEELRRLLQ